MSIPRLLGIIALALFIVFVASFFTVLVRLSRIGVTTERFAVIETAEASDEDPTLTHFDIIGLSENSSRLNVEITTRIDISQYPFNTLSDGDVLRLRMENLVPELKRNVDIDTVFHSPPGSEHYVNLSFGTVDWDVLDRRDFYPFDGYEFSFNLAYYVPGDSPASPGSWYEPESVEIRSLTNMILLNARFGATATEGESGFRTRIARLRILQYFTVTLLLIEILFLVYLLTIVNMQELLTKGLGYLVGLYIVREVLVTNAPQFPTLIDYSTMFLICVVFFLMLFKFLGGAEEHALITIPPRWHDTLIGAPKPTDKNDTGKNGDEEN